MNVQIKWIGHYTTDKEVVINGVYVGRAVKEIDGSYYFCANSRTGLFPSWALKEIANELDKLNNEQEESK